MHVPTSPANEVPSLCKRYLFLRFFCFCFQAQYAVALLSQAIGSSGSELFTLKYQWLYKVSGKGRTPDRNFIRGHSIYFGPFPK